MPVPKRKDKRETQPRPAAGRRRRCTRRQALALALALVGAVSGTQASAAPLLAVRFFDDNPLAQGPSLAAPSQRELEAATGLALVPRGRTTDGAFLFALASPAGPASLRPALNALRASGAVVYAEAVDDAARPATASEPARAILVTLRANAKGDAAARLRAAVALKTGSDVAPARALGGDARRIDLPRPLRAAEAAELVASLAAQPGVAHVEVDRRAFVQSTPSDPLFASQWNLIDAVGGINAPAAWAITTGAANAPIAVLDTGALPHPDLAGRVLPGYDLVADSAFAGDGDGRDPDPTDPGDFVEALASSDPQHRLFNCPVTNSTWHGTMVAGMLGAATNNAAGVASINWTSPLLNVRVLGKCGGALSDIADGIRWAAGLPVPGVPANTRPARVINLSMSGQGACGPILQSAVTEAIARGAVIVAAAGNDGVDVADRWPANCNGVIAVGATARNGARAFYSNFGERLALSAPGGGVGGSILVLRNGGATIADAQGYVIAQQVGTSLAAPHVAGTVSLMQAIAPQLTPAEIHAALEGSARPFPAVDSEACTPTLCGAGIVDAATAMQGLGRADAPPPPAAPPTPSPPPHSPPPAPEPGRPPTQRPDAPPPVRVPLPGGWSAKDPHALERMLKHERGEAVSPARGRDARRTGSRVAAWL